MLCGNTRKSQRPCFQVKIKHMASCLHCDYRGSIQAELCPKCGRPIRERKPGIFELQSREFFFGAATIIVALVAILTPVYFQAVSASKALFQLWNAQQITLVLMEYASDNDDRFPTFTNPTEATEKIKSRFSSPDLISASNSMSWNVAISGAKLNELPKGDKTVILWCPKYGSDEYSIVTLAAGHGRSMKNEALKNLLK